MLSYNRQRQSKVVSDISSCIPVSCQDWTHMVNSWEAWTEAVLFLVGVQVKIVLSVISRWIKDVYVFDGRGSRMVSRWVVPNGEFCECQVSTVLARKTYTISTRMVLIPSEIAAAVVPKAFKMNTELAQSLHVWPAAAVSLSNVGTSPLKSFLLCSKGCYTGKVRKWHPNKTRWQVCLVRRLMLLQWHHRANVTFVAKSSCWTF